MKCSAIHIAQTGFIVQLIWSLSDQVSLMDEAGNTKDDLSLPKVTDDAEKLAQQIQEDFDAGKELVVTVLKVSSSLCNFSKIVHSSNPSHPSHQWMLKASSQRQRQPFQGHSCMAQQTQQHCCIKFMGKAYTECFSFRCIVDTCSDSSGINQGWSSCAAF